ncbi:MAG: hypothetical protein ACKVQB_09325 [Bacteroidia bacterium]
MEWSNTQKLRGNSIFTTILGEDESGIYVLRHRNKFLSKFIVLERYRNNLGLESSKSFLLKNTRIIYSDINETGILLIKQIFDKKAGNYKIVATVLNNSFENVKPETLITWVNHPFSNASPTLIIKPSFDHKHYFIFNYGLTNLPINFNRFTIIDQQINVIEQGEFYFEKEWKIETIEDIILDKNLEFSLLLKSKKNISGFNTLAIYEQNKIKQLADSNYSLDKPIIFYNTSTGQKGVSGFYTSDIENGFEGDFSFQWKNLFPDSLKLNKQPFSRHIIKELAGEVKAQSGFLPPTYFPLKVICRSDGGFVKISENSYTQKEQDVMMANGVASTQGKNIYSFENILIQNFDSSGQLYWENWVSKNQNTVNDGGLLSSVFISVTLSSVNILFNDPIATGGDIVLANFSPGGLREIKVAAKGDEMNAFIIPAEGKQISGDKIIVPVLKDRKFALLKITFKQ